MHNRSPDSTLSPSSVLAKWSQIAVQIGTLTGKTFEIAENMAGLIREAGFVDVVEKRYRWPIGPWSSDPRLKELGRWNLLNWEEGMEGWILANYTRVLGVGCILPYFPFWGRFPTPPAPPAFVCAPSLFLCFFASLFLFFPSVSFSFLLSHVSALLSFPLLFVPFPISSFHPLVYDKWDLSKGQN